MTIASPTSLVDDDLRTQFDAAHSVFHEMSNYPRSSGTVDISSAEWFTPAFLAPVSVAAMHHGDSLDTGFDFPEKPGIQAYLDQIGFPDGAVSPTKQYQNHLPLCRLNTNTDTDAVEIVGSKMSDLLANQFADAPSGTITAVQYPMHELIDNVDYHSRCDNGSLLIQNYPNKSYLDICVADDGVSIPGSYDDFDIEFESDVDALLKATNGVSTKPNTGHERGYGLRTTTELICDGLDGEVLLASRDGFIHRKGDGDFSTASEEIHWPGTVFVARLEMPDESFPWKRYV